MKKGKLLNDYGGRLRLNEADYESISWSWDGIYDSCSGEFDVDKNHVLHHTFFPWTDESKTLRSEQEISIDIDFGIHTLDELADYINSSDSYPLDVETIIAENCWTSSNKDYDICYSDNEMLVFDERGQAVVEKLEEFKSIEQAMKHGFRVEKSLSDQWRLMYYPSNVPEDEQCQVNGTLVFEDPGNHDMYDYDLAVEYMLEPANEYYKGLYNLVNSVADFGAGPELIEDIDEAFEVQTLYIDKFGSTKIDKSDERFIDICERLQVDPNNVKSAYWIGANVCACYAELN